MAEQVGSGTSRLKTELTQDGKCTRRLLMVGKIFGMNIVRLWEEVKQLAIENKLKYLE